MIRLSEREKLMQKLDVFQGPWGLYEQDGRLFLLSRELEKGVSRWSLDEVIIKDKRVEETRSFVLPTKSSQITLVPGAESGEWLIFEQNRRLGADGEVFRSYEGFKRCAGILAEAH